MKVALAQNNMTIISEKEATYFRLNTLRWMLKEKHCLRSLVSITGSGPSDFRRSLERGGMTLGIWFSNFVNALIFRT